LLKYNISEQKKDNSKLLKSEERCKRICKEMQQYIELKKLFKKDVIGLMKFTIVLKKLKSMIKDLFGIQI